MEIKSEHKYQWREIKKIRTVNAVTMGKQKTEPFTRRKADK